MSGIQIKEFAHAKGVKLWQVAERLGLSDSNFSRRMRKPFSEEDSARIKAIIEQLAVAQNSAEGVA